MKKRSQDLDLLYMPYTPSFLWTLTKKPFLRSCLASALADAPPERQASKRNLFLLYFFDNLNVMLSSFDLAYINNVEEVIHKKGET